MHNWTPHNCLTHTCNLTFTETHDRRLSRRVANDVRALMLDWTSSQTCDDTFVRGRLSDVTSDVTGREARRVMKHLCCVRISDVWSDVSSDVCGRVVQLNTLLPDSEAPKSVTVRISNFHGLLRSILLGDSLKSDGAHNYVILDNSHCWSTFQLLLSLRPHVWLDVCQTSDHTSDETCRLRLKGICWKNPKKWAVT
jgi:hypothetical protein